MTCIIDDMYRYKSFPHYGFGFFGGGGLIRFYSYSLYWLAHFAGLNSVVAGVLNDGEPIIHGALSLEELERLVNEGRLVALKWYPWGVRWPYHKQPQGCSARDFERYLDWRNGLLMAAGEVKYDPCDLTDYRDRVLRLA